jgi:hypothetical protein
MIQIAFPACSLDELRRGLADRDVESAAIVLCAPVHTAARDDWRLIVRETHVAGVDDYEERTASAARLKPEFGLPFERKARENGWSLVYCHSHVGAAPLRDFSPTDDVTEMALATYAEGRSPNVPHGAVLIVGDAVLARRLGTRESVRVVSAGVSAAEETPVPTEAGLEDIYDRQIRAFGAEGQRRLQRRCVAIVGLGGTGSAAALQLAHLGVVDFLLVDRDFIDKSNLNRTYGATPTDIGKPKVEVAARMIRSIRPDARVRCVVGDVTDEEVAHALLGVGIALSCTDSHASRHLLNQMAYQYALPVIDMGVAIDASAGNRAAIAGHVKALAPGLACLWCMGSLDPQQVRQELMNPEQRQQDPYFRGTKGPVQPAVISVNSTVVSAAITMLLAMVAGLDSPPRYVVYDGNRQRMAAVEIAPVAGCNFCGAESTCLAGDTAPLPTRRK